MDANDQLSELDERLKRGEIRLPEYFQLRSQLLSDPSLADGSITYPPVEAANQNDDTVPPPIDYAGQQGVGQHAAEQGEDVAAPYLPPPYQPSQFDQPRYQQHAEPAPYQPPLPEPDASTVDAESSVDDVDVTVRRSSVQYQLPTPPTAQDPWQQEVGTQQAHEQQPYEQQTYAQQSYAQQSYEQQPYGQPGNAGYQPSGPAVSDPSPWTQPRVPAGKSLTRKRRRNTLIGVAVVVVLAIAGTGTWLLTRHDDTQSAPPPGVSVADPSHPILDVSGFSVVAKYTGATNPAEAAQQVFLYPFEQTKLTACGANGGLKQVLLGAGAKVTATHFRCKDAASAAGVVKDTNAWEQSALQFAPTTSPVDGVVALMGTKHVRGLPVEYHARYTSGTEVLDLVVGANTSDAASKALQQTLTVLTKNFPPK